MRIIKTPSANQGESVNVDIDGKKYKAKAHTNLSGKGVVFRKQNGQIGVIGNNPVRQDSQKQITKNRRRRGGEEFLIKLLGYRELPEGRQYMVGGDRTRPADIYEPVNAVPRFGEPFRESRIANLGKRKRDWIVTLKWEDDDVKLSWPTNYRIGDLAGLTEQEYEDIFQFEPVQQVLAIVNSTTTTEFNKDGLSPQVVSSRFCGAGFLTMDSTRDTGSQLNNGFGSPASFPAAPPILDSRRILYQDEWRSPTAGATFFPTIVYGSNDLDFPQLLPRQEILLSYYDDPSFPTFGTTNPNYSLVTHGGVRVWLNDFAASDFKGSVIGGTVSSFEIKQYAAGYRSAFGLGGQLITNVRIDDTNLQRYHDIFFIQQADLTIPFHSVNADTQSVIIPPYYSDSGYLFTNPNTSKDDYTFFLLNRSENAPSNAIAQVYDLIVTELDNYFKPVYFFDINQYNSSNIEYVYSEILARVQLSQINNNIVTGDRVVNLRKTSPLTTEITLLGVTFSLNEQLVDYEARQALTAIGDIKGNYDIEIPYLKFKGIEENTGIVAIWKNSFRRDNNDIASSISEDYYFVQGGQTLLLNDLGDFDNGNGFLDLYKDTSAITLKGNKIYLVDLTPSKAQRLRTRRTNLDVTTYTINDQGNIVKGRTKQYPVLPLKRAGEVIGASFFV